MHLKCGGIFNDFNDCFITHLLLSLKNFENRSTVGEVTGKNQVSCLYVPLFCATLYIIIIIIIINIVQEKKRERDSCKISYNTKRTEST